MLACTTEGDSQAVRHRDDMGEKEHRFQWISTNVCFKWLDQVLDHIWYISQLVRILSLLCEYLSLQSVLLAWVIEKKNNECDAHNANVWLASLDVWFDKKHTTITRP